MWILIVLALLAVRSTFLMRCLGVLVIYAAWELTR